MWSRVGGASDVNFMCERGNGMYYVPRRQVSVARQQVGIERGIQVRRALWRCLGLGADPGWTGAEDAFLGLLRAFGRERPT